MSKLNHVAVNSTVVLDFPYITVIAALYDKIESHNVSMVYLFTNLFIT
jgi:hypothetical protein